MAPFKSLLFLGLAICNVRSDAEPNSPYDYGYRLNLYERGYTNVSVPKYLPKTTPEVVLAATEEPEPVPEPHHKPSHAEKYSKKTYKKPEYCDPKKPPACARDAKFGYCSVDPEYPFEELGEILVKSPLLARQYSELKDQSADDLVNEISKQQEEAFDFSYYTGAFTFDKTHWVGPEGYMCPSDVTYERPLRAMNTNGEWRVIVNDPSHCTQTQRVEICRHPGAACRLLAPCYGSKCLQKFAYHRILSYDPCYPDRGLFIDVFKLPSACSCHIPTRK